MIANGFRLISNIFMFNRLGETKYGILNFEITTFIVLSVILSLGIETNYVRKSRNISPRSKTLFNSALIIKIFQVLTSFPIFLIIFFIRNLSLQELVLIFLSYGGRCYFNLFVAYFSTINLRWKAGVGDLIREGILFLFIILFQVKDFSLFLVFVTLCEVCGLLILIFFSLSSLKKINRDRSVSYKILFESSVKLTILQLLTYSTIYLCMFFLSKNELGIFTYANSFAGILGMGTAIIANTLFPHYSSIINFKSIKDCKKEIGLHTLVIIGLSLILIIILLLIPVFKPIRLFLDNIGVTHDIFHVIFILAVYYLITAIIVPVYRFSLVLEWDKEIIFASTSGMIIQILSLIVFKKLAYLSALSLIFGISVNLFLLWIFLAIKGKKGFKMHELSI